jgi:hypothetical protein
MASFEEMNPGVVKTDGHAERVALGLPPTEATPYHLRKSSGIDGDAGDWTQTKGEGLTDNTASKAEILHNANGTFAVVRDGKSLGVFKTLAEAEKAAA